jgi:hypothetical protein
MFFQGDSLLALLCVGLVAGSACAAPDMPPVAFASRTSIAMANSVRCSTVRCRCRPLDSDREQEERNTPQGQKRFEFRLPRSTSAIWVDVSGHGTFYKAGSEIEPACFYLDLAAPGEHELTIHGQALDPLTGLQTGLEIYEFGPRRRSWYRTLNFVCGGLQTCMRTDFVLWKQYQEKLPRGVLDPCGSTMVRAVRSAGTFGSRGDESYRDLTLRLKLKVYGFETHQEPRSPRCRAPVKNS